MRLKLPSNGVAPRKEHPYQTREPYCACMDQGRPSLVALAGGFVNPLCDDVRGRQRCHDTCIRKTWGHRTRRVQGDLRDWGYGLWGRSLSW